MGTNYYVQAECDVCGHVRRQHIGKSSAGWVFALQADEENKLLDWPTWRSYLDGQVSSGWEIRDEYGRSVSLEDLEKVVLERWTSREHLPSDEWLRENHAEVGPNGLAVGVGDRYRQVTRPEPEQTYEVCYYEFS